MPSILRSILLVSLSCAGLGCAVLGLQSPTAAVAGMSVKDVNAHGFTMNFDVKVTNPNSVLLPLTAMDYKLGVGGTQLLNGKAVPEGSIPAHETRSVVVPISMTFENLLAAEKAIHTSGGNLPYALDAGLNFDTGTTMMGSLRTPLHYDGTLALRDILSNPRALLESDAAKRLAAAVFSHMVK